MEGKKQCGGERDKESSSKRGGGQVSSRGNRWMKKWDGTKSVDEERADVCFIQGVRHHRRGKMGGRVSIA